MSRSQMVGQLEMLRMELDDLLDQKQLLDVLVDDAARQFQELQTEIAVEDILADMKPLEACDLDAVGFGEDMTTSKLLAKALDREDLGVRRGFLTLDEGGKAAIEAGYRRHALMCHKNDIPPDPSWLREAVHDAVHVPPGERSGQLSVVSDQQEIDPLATEHRQLNTAFGEMVNQAFHTAGGVGPVGFEVLRAKA